MASKPLGTRYLSDMVHQARILGPNAPGGPEEKHVALPRPSYDLDTASLSCADHPLWTSPFSVFLITVHESLL